MRSLLSTVLVQLALLEDVGTGDITTESTIGEDAVGSAVFLSRQSLVVCGHEIAAEVFSQVTERYGYHADYQTLAKEGDEVEPETKIARVSGSLRAILLAERTALNFMQHLSGISSHTRESLKHSPSTLTILDTRKTTPGYRDLEKHAVRVGGATNHRVGLYDQVLIKNNHIDAVGGDIAETIRRARSYAPPGMVIEVEVRDHKELQAALEAQPDRILLDNMSNEELSRSVEIVRQSDAKKRILLEASGGISAERLKALADTGVDAVSMGALTHSAPSVDISLRYESE